MNTFLILRRAGWANPLELEKAAGVAARVVHEEMPARVRWMRSYITRHSGDRLGTVCIFQATDAETVAEHALRAGIPADEIIQVTDTVLINDDTPANA